MRRVPRQGRSRETVRAVLDAVLGVAPNASRDEIRAAWRRLVRETHPDRLIAQGVPEEFVVLATDKLATINEAYERITRERGQA